MLLLIRKTEGQNKHLTAPCIGCTYISHTIILVPMILSILDVIPVLLVMTREGLPLLFCVVRIIRYIACLSLKKSDPVCETSIDPIRNPPVDCWYRKSNYSKNIYYWPRHNTCIWDRPGHKVPSYFVCLNLLH